MPEARSDMDPRAQCKLLLPTGNPPDIDEVHGRFSITFYDLHEVFFDQSSFLCFRELTSGNHVDCDRWNRIPVNVLPPPFNIHELNFDSVITLVVTAMSASHSSLVISATSTLTYQMPSTTRAISCRSAEILSIAMFTSSSPPPKTQAERKAMHSWPAYDPTSTYAVAAPMHGSPQN